MNAYADSSFIVALYLQQQSSPKAILLMQAYGKRLPFTPWHRLEVRNAIRLAAFYKAIAPDQVASQLKQVESDLKEELLLSHLVIDWTDVLRDAEKLGATFNQKIGCRSSDLFHVAAARTNRFDTFFTFDDKQKSMARAAGLTVKP